jgi:hypothetical protein
MAREKVDVDNLDDCLTPEEAIRATALKCAVNTYSGGSSQEILQIARRYERYIKGGEY